MISILSTTLTGYFQQSLTAPVIKLSIALLTAGSANKLLTAQTLTVFVCINGAKYPQKIVNGYEIVNGRF